MNSIDTVYRPRPLQEWLHAKRRRFNVFVMHRRFGKTTFAVNDTLDEAMRNPLRNPQYAYLAPTYSQAKRVVWDLLKDIALKIPGATTNESDLRVEIPRATAGGEDRIRIMLLGAENPGALRGIYLDGAILDEYSEMDPTVYTQVIRPALSDRLGWATFIGTPKGNNHFAKVYKYAESEMNKPDSQWFAALFKASETKIIPQNELDAARAIMPPEEYEQEFECSFSAALIGAYYKNEFTKIETEKRIMKVPYETGFPVITFWDLGIDDSTAVWCMQQIGRERRFIRYYETAGQGFEAITRELRQFGYQYAEHFLPHDAAVRELGTGVSRQETLQRMWPGVRITVVKKLAVADGIEATRNFLSGSYFDAELCAKGIDCLKSYEREFNAKEGVYLLKPRHNWASHGADAMRTGAVAFRVDAPDYYGIGGRQLPDMANLEYDVFGH